MDIQTRKIEFIQRFLNIQNEQLISNFEALMESSIRAERRLNPMAVDELEIRVEQSLEDSRSGRLTKQDKLLAEIEEWK